MVAFGALRPVFALRTQQFLATVWYLTAHGMRSAAGDRAAARDAFAIAEAKTAGVGQKMDLAFSLLRLDMAAGDWQVGPLGTKGSHGRTGSCVMASWHQSRNTTLVNHAACHGVASCTTSPRTAGQ